MIVNKTKAIAKNMSVTILYQLISIVFGFLIPRMLLVKYGASIHGLTSTITNIMSYIMLLNAGLTTAAIQSLYKPLGINDTHRINEVYNAIKRFYYKTGIAFLIAVSIVAFILPIIIGSEIESLTVFLLMITMGLQQILDCFLISSSRALLQANQKMYATYRINIIAFILRGIIQIVLISNNCSIIIVQAVLPSLVLFRFIIMNVYIKKHYNYLNKKIIADNSALNKRWAAFVHQIAGLILNNTDVIILTIFANQVMVSVYAVYQIVFSHLYSLVINVFSTGSVASFGQLLVVEDHISIQKKFRKFELLYFFIVTIVYSVCAVMILPFVALYTADVVEINYAESKLGFLFVLSGLFNNLRVPALTIIDAAGHYKETQSRAIIEMSINLIVTLMLVQNFGIYGVLIGTIVSFLYRTTDMIIYANRNILHSNSIISFRRVLVALLTVGINIIIAKYYINFEVINWYYWIIKSVVVTLVAITITSVINYFVDRETFVDLVKIVKHLLKSKIKDKPNFN
jgi:O-antigen/teichoic acid export membrane protein